MRVGHRAGRADSQLRQRVRLLERHPRHVVRGPGRARPTGRSSVSTSSGARPPPWLAGRFLPSVARAPSPRASGASRSRRVAASARSLENGCWWGAEVLARDSRAPDRRRAGRRAGGHRAQRAVARALAVDAQAAAHLRGRRPVQHARERGVGTGQAGDRRPRSCRSPRARRQAHGDRGGDRELAPGSELRREGEGDALLRGTPDAARARAEVGRPRAHRSMVHSRSGNLASGSPAGRSGMMSVRPLAATQAGGN